MQPFRFLKHLYLSAENFDVYLMDEKALIEACLQNNYRAQKTLYQSFAPQMMGVCMRYASCEADAEDILQEGFVKIFKHLDSFQSKGSLGGWMRRIMVNTALQRFRGSKNTLLVRLDHKDVQVVEVSEDALQQMSAEELMRKIQQLPVGFRTVFNLYAIDGFKHHEIAEQLQITEGTSKSQYSRSKAMLREMIENDNRSSERAV